MRGRALTSPLTNVENGRLADIRAKRYAPRTLKTYIQKWDKVCSWLENRGIQPALPIHQDLVALYILEQSGRYSWNSLNSALSAIAYQHREHGYRSPTETAVVREVRASRRSNRGMASQVKPLGAANLATVVDTAFLPRPSNDINRSAGGYELMYVALKRGALDVAIVTTMFDALLRLNEAAELLWADISYNRDRSGLLYIRHSKNDQEGRGAFQWLSPQTMEYLESIRPTGQDPDARVFGLTKWTIQLRIRLMALAAGLGPGYSGHSPRIGMIHELVTAGMSHTLIIHAARWRIPSMLATYTRQLETTKGAVAQFYGAYADGSEEVRNHQTPIAIRYMKRTV